MSDFGPLYAQAAQQYNLDPNILKSLVSVESGGNPNALNPTTGASGLLQFIPATAKAYGIDPTNPAQAINAGAQMFRQNLDRFNGDVSSAVAAHFAGPDQAQWGPKTSAYVQKVATAFNGMQNNTGAPPVTNTPATNAPANPSVDAWLGKPQAQAPATAQSPDVGAWLGKSANGTPAAPPPAASAAPPVPNNADVAINSANKGLASVPDSILNTPNRILNLGRAAFGTVADAFGRPDLAPDLTPDPNYVGSFLNKVGATNPNFDPQTTGQHILDTAMQTGAGSILAPANSVRQLVTNMALGGTSGLASGATKAATGSDALALTAGLGAVPASMGLINAATNRVNALNLAQSQNSVKDATLANAKDAGYVVSPSEANSTGVRGTINQVVEGLAGKLSTRQLASQKNQPVTNQLARTEVGLPQDQPITSGAMQLIRNQAYQDGYAPVAQIGTVRTGGAYRSDLDNIVSKYTGAANSFPGAVSDDIANLIDPLRVKSFDAGDALNMTQILRNNATKAFSSGDTALGGANRAAATAIENQIERNLPANGGGLLQGFQDARTLMAKTHAVEDATHEGTGNVQASKLGAQLQAGKPLSGGLLTTGSMADAFPKNMQSPETMGATPGLSPLDFFTGAGTGLMVAAASGHPQAALAGLLPLARPVARSLLLSSPYQRLMTKPSYSPSLLTQGLAAGSVQNPAANAGLLGSILSNQVLRAQ